MEIRRLTWPRMRISRIEQGENLMKTTIAVMHRTSRLAFVVLAASFFSIVRVGNASASITIATVPVGNPGNAPELSNGYDFGEVDYDYNIGKYDVTLGQYAAFLNGVAASDTYGLYNSEMGSAFPTSGITQSGVSGNYRYTAFGNANYPVTFVSFWDAARFANWLNNGQPTGTEDATTDNGSYTLTPTAIAHDTVTRNASATWALTSENEWFKAAYYNPATASYYEYATQSNTAPSNVLSATGTNNANYDDAEAGFTDPTNDLTPVGAFASSPSAYGTYDQSGDVEDWNESVYEGSYRGLRGGSWGGPASETSSDALSYDRPTNVSSGYEGFRVSQVPEPASIGIAAVGMMGLLVRRRIVRKSAGRCGPTSAHLSH